jgi:hypothetical protein
MCGGTPECTRRWRVRRRQGENEPAREWDVALTDGKVQGMTIATFFGGDWKYLSTLVGFILTIAGLSFTGYNLWRNGRSQRAAMMLNMIDHYLSDVDMRDLYYRIHYGQFSIFLMR